MRRLVAGQSNGFVQQRLVGHHLAATGARIGAHDGHGRRVFDAAGQRMAGKATKHHRMDGPQACTGQHGKGGLGDHGHVNQDPIALLHALGHQDRGHALHLGVQLAKAVGLLDVGFGGDKDQRVLVGAVFEVPVHRVVAQVGQATLKPAGKRRVVVVADPVKRFVPIDELGLFGPEGIAVFDGAAVEVGVGLAVVLMGCLLGWWCG